MQNLPPGLARLPEAQARQHLEVGGHLAETQAALRMSLVNLPILLVLVRTLGQTCSISHTRGLGVRNVSTFLYPIPSISLNRRTQRTLQEEHLILVLLP